MESLVLGDVQSMLESYHQWLRDKTILKQIDSEWVEVTTPNLDRHNDYLQIYIRKEGNGYLLTDDGYIIDDLITSGCKLDTSRRKELLDLTVNGFGVRRDENNRLIVSATQDNFPIKKHSLLQVMLAVNDMFYLSTPHISSLFLEDVIQWLDDSDIRYTPSIKLPGKSGFDNMFDFIIPKSRKKPERLIQIAPYPNKNKIKDLMFRWKDTQEIRGTDVKSYTILNNQENPIAASFIEALQAYESTPIPWSERDEFAEELAS